jgi:hypothetical protein
MDEFAGISVFVGLLSVVFGILSLVLFFKIWGLTNTVKDIREVLTRIQHSIAGPEERAEFLNTPSGIPSEEIKHKSAKGVVWLMVIFAALLVLALMLGR